MNLFFLDRPRRRLAQRLLALGALLPAVAGAATLQVRGDAPLALEVQSVQWTLSGPFAEQQVDVVLRNPSARAVEGTVLLPLAANERLKGYALDIEGQLRDAVPVERTKARAAFESTVRQQVDPALLEQDVGNRYRLRVFPIPAQGERRMRFTIASLAGRDRCGWRHRISGDVLPLGSHAVATLVSTDATRPEAGGLAWTDLADGKGWRGQVRLSAGGGSLQVCLSAPLAPVGYTHTESDGTTMLWVERWGREHPVLTPRLIPEHLEIVWDASLQSPRDRSADLAVLDRFFQGASTRVTLTVLRQDIERRSFDIVDGDWRALAEHLQGLRPLGATNLHAWIAEPDAQEVFFFSDAAATWPSNTEIKHPGKPVFVLGNGIRDAAKAQWLAQEGGRVIDLARRSVDSAVRELRQVEPLRLMGGWSQRDWHAPSQTPEDGILRACHVASRGEEGETPALRLERKGEVSDVRPVDAQPQPMAGFWCAIWWTQTLEADPQRHRGQLAELGQRYGVVNRETSLLVLESEEDYVRHGILPSDANPTLRDAVILARSRQEQARAESAARNREVIARLWEERRLWWATEFPKTLPKRGSEEDDDRRPIASAPLMESPPPPPSPSPMQEPMAPQDAAAAEPDVQAAVSPNSAVAPSMSLRAVSMSEPYTGDLKASADVDALMQAYDRLVLSYGESPAFHFDVAERLFELGAKPLAVEVLSNIVELMPSEHAALRLVAYRLQQASADVPALELFHRIRELAPEEPQSYRDLALALARDGRCEPAASLFSHVVETPWDSRFAEIGVIALAEANDLAVHCGRRVREGLAEDWRAPLPVDLRVVLRWDIDDTDIDLHITDPLGETVYYSNREGRQGGRLSRDFTGGYGPEEFILRKPVPGVYTVKVNYFGSRVAKLARGAGVDIQLQTGFATPRVKTKSMAMRLSEESGLIEVGRFEVRRNGSLVQ